jgi:hypothetical protein
VAKPKSKTQLLRENAAVLIDALRELGYGVETSPRNAQPRLGLTWFSVRMPQTFTRKIGGQSPNFIHWMASIHVNLNGRIKIMPIGGISPYRTYRNNGDEPVEKTDEESRRDANEIRTALKKIGLGEWLD